MATQHVIIGGGPAATNAMETIRELDKQALITLISDEPAHSRMALPYWLSAQIPPAHTHTPRMRRFFNSSMLTPASDNESPQSIQMARL